MNLLVGIGNFGTKYQKTRHNIGFMLIDQLVFDWNLEFMGKKFFSEIFQGKIADQKVIAIKPQTYVNLSGLAVSSTKNFFKIPTKKILAIHDDLDLKLGRIKIKLAGSNGGHNGIKSIDSSIGNNYWRMRLGIGRPETATTTISDYVLSDFEDKDLLQVKKIANNVSKNIEMIIGKNSENHKNYQDFLNQILR